jgi:hypothetical protein
MAPWCCGASSCRSAAPRLRVLAATCRPPCGPAFWESWAWFLAGSCCLRSRSPTHSPGSGRRHWMVPASIRFCRIPVWPSIRRFSIPAMSDFRLPSPLQSPPCLKAGSTPPGDAGSGPGRCSHGVSSPPESPLVPGGLIIRWAGADTGSGTRWKTRHCCPGCPARHFCIARSWWKSARR